MKNLGRVVVLAISLSLGLAACSSGSDTTVEYEDGMVDRSIEASPCLPLVRLADRDRVFNARSVITLQDIDQDLSTEAIEYRVLGTLTDVSENGSKTFEWICNVSQKEESLRADLVSITERVDLRQVDRMPRT